MRRRRALVLVAVAAAAVGVQAGEAGAAEPVTISVAPSPAVVEHFAGGPCYVGQIEVTQPAGFNLTRTGSTAQALSLVVQSGVHVTTSDVLLAPQDVNVTFPVGSATVFVPRRDGGEPFLGPAHWTLTAPITPPGGATTSASFDGYDPPTGGGDGPCNLVDETIEETILVNQPYFAEGSLTHTREFVLQSGTLPPGMAVDPEAGPSGTPTQLGTFSAVVEVCPFPKLGQVICGDRTYDLTVATELPPGSVERLAGDDRIATALVTSQRIWEATDAVVLARADTFPDALVGGPLAHHVEGPLLLTPSGGLDARVRAEIDRLLDPGDRVLLLGGPTALGPGIEAELAGAGYDVRRLAGPNRYATAVAVALAMGTPSDILLADGTNFPDALVAGAAAASVDGAVLLTNGSQLPSETDAYLFAADPIAIGGPAAAALPSAPAIVGPDRYRTAIGVASLFFGRNRTVGLATGQNFPDALAGAAHIAALGGPLLLTPTLTLDPNVDDYLEFLRDPTQVFIYGGFAAVSFDAEHGVRVAVHAPIILF